MEKMKKLKKIKLINWHRFINETLEIKDSILLSGENGAGKSTILDAMQLVLTCSKNNFNKAANEKGKRNLVGYVRCKTGEEGKPFERTGQISSHIALEFYDENKNKSFILGAVIDSSSETNEKTIWYRMDNSKIEEEMFFNGKIPKKIDEFKRVKKVNAFNSMAEAKRNFKLAYGNIEDKFFELIPKAMAFKPIDDIKEFVYSYVLDNKEVKIDDLKENVRMYQEFELILRKIKQQINSLQEIEVKYKGIIDLNKLDIKYDYYIKKINQLIEEEKIYNLERDANILEDKIKALKLKENDLEKSILSIKNKKENLEYELKNNEDYIALAEVIKDIEKIAVAIKDIDEERKSFNRKSKEATSNLKKIIEKSHTIEASRNCLKELENFEMNLDEGILKNAINEFEVEKEGIIQDLNETSFNEESNRKSKNKELIDVNNKISELENKKLQYDKNIIDLIDEIEKTFKRVGKTVEPRILCELLTITDEKWKNAIEGYLNTQRFYIIVPPEDFDLAQKVYERVKREKRIHSIGLVNTGKLEGYDNSKEGTLATVVTSKSLWAKRFVNMILGKVFLCKDSTKIKEYKCAITEDCMIYQNNVLRAINPKVYETPYIGEDAYKVQLNQAIIEKEKLSEELKVIKDSINIINEKQNLFKDDSLVYIKHKLDILPKYKSLINNLEALKGERKTLEENNSFIEKQLMVEELKNEINKLDGQSKDIFVKLGGEDNKLENCKSGIESSKQTLIYLIGEVNKEKEKLGELLSEVEGDFLKVIKDKDLPTARMNTSKYKEGLKTRILNSNAELNKLQYEYKVKYDFGPEATFDGAKFFIDELTKLKTSEVLSYEEKVQNAKEKAEIEFKEQFLSKLRENINEAQREFKSLNKALKDIKFGLESYEFKQSASKKYSKYYKMIMDDFNMVEGFSLFSGQFNDDHQEVINELFERLTEENNNSTKILEEFTDYRTYMDYDILVKQGEDKSFLYSKVSKEKSGGETQTPFYVTIAASFVQLYSNSISNSIGIIMFDEAFDKMDDERINGVLEFLIKLESLQIIIAAPPEKIQYIGPKVKSTLLVLKDGNTSYVEDFNYE